MAAEQEITISYASLTAEGGGAVPASARQEYLRDTFAFECACAACVAGDALPRVGQPPQLDGFSQPPAPSQKHRTLMLASVGVKDKYVFILHVHPRDASARVDAYCVNFGCERVHLSDDQMRAARDALTAGGGEAAGAALHAQLDKSVRLGRLLNCRACGAEQAEAVRLQACDRWFRVKYCSTACRKRDWRAHRDFFLKCDRRPSLEKNATTYYAADARRG